MKYDVNTISRIVSAKTTYDENLVHDVCTWFSKEIALKMRERGTTTVSIPGFGKFRITKEGLRKLFRKSIKSVDIVKNKKNTDKNEIDMAIRKSEDILERYNRKKLEDEIIFHKTNRGFINEKYNCRYVDIKTIEGDIHGSIQDYLQNKICGGHSIEEIYDM